MLPLNFIKGQFPLVLEITENVYCERKIFHGVRLKTNAGVASSKSTNQLWYDC